RLSRGSPLSPKCAAWYHRFYRFRAVDSLDRVPSDHARQGAGRRLAIIGLHSLAHVWRNYRIYCLPDLGAACDASGRQPACVKGSKSRDRSATALSDWCDSLRDDRDATLVFTKSFVLSISASGPGHEPTRVWSYSRKHHFRPHPRRLEDRRTS